MKKHLKTLFSAICCLCIALTCIAAAENMTWREYEIELTEVKTGGFFAPADMKADEYCVTAVITVPKDLAEDSDLMGAMYDEIILTDPAGNAYKPGALMSNETAESFLFAVPETVAKEDLTVSFGAAAESGDPEETAENPGTPAEISLENGETMILTPIEASSFADQGDKVIVHTRIGDTNHNSGSTFTAGSGLRLENMRNTKQYEMPRVTFTCETGLEFSEMADALGEIGKNAVLRADGAEYTPVLAWITEEMACYIFDCEELPDTLPSFTLEDGKLVIGF